MPSKVQLERVAGPSSHYFDYLEWNVSHEVFECGANADVVAEFGFNVGSAGKGREVILEFFL